MPHDAERFVFFFVAASRFFGARVRVKLVLAAAFRFFGGAMSFFFFFLSGFCLLAREVAVFALLGFFAALR